jgi:hypothetical protein
MRFSQFFELFLNPHMYDLSTPQGREYYQKDLEDLKQWEKERANRPTEIKREPHREQYNLTLWRGCTEQGLQIMTIAQGPGYRILDGTKSRSGALWFAHKLQGESGLNLAQSYDIFITHNLLCTAYYDVVTLSNGETRQEPNQEMAEKDGWLVESPVGVFGHLVIELPADWSFSEHREKHVLCYGQVKIAENAIVRNQ